MNEFALQTVFINPKQAPGQAMAAFKGQVAPFCNELWGQGVERLRVTVQPEEDAKTDQQRRYYHGVILTEITEQAKANGQSFPFKVWKEYFRDCFLGFKVKTFVNPMTGKKSRRRVRISTEGLGVRAYNKLIEQVTALAVTELNVRFSCDRWEDYRP